MEDIFVLKYCYGDYEDYREQDLFYGTESEILFKQEEAVKLLKTLGTRANNLIDKQIKNNKDYYLWSEEIVRRYLRKLNLPSNHGERGIFRVEKIISYESFKKKYKGLINTKENI